MNYLEELSIQLNKLSAGDWVKINIHFNINGNLLNVCEQINQEANSHLNGLIKFGTKSILVPHISVFMGYINTFEKFENILQLVSDYAHSCDAFRINPSHLYFKSFSPKTSQYLFLDFLQKDKVVLAKDHFCTCLNNLTKPLEWDFKNEIPHITLGCYNPLTSNNKIVDKYHEFPCCDIKEIGISISGKKGVCLGNLKTFELNNCAL